VRRAVMLAAGLAVLLAGPASAQNTVFLEDLTWTEVRDAVRSGVTTVIIPTGGTEQNGPHMILGKHNYLVRAGSEALARRLGNALVAPVMAYVPEGDISPPTVHMWAPGTITLPDEYFSRVVEYAARSFAPHGFTDIILIGDSGGNQSPLQAVAASLNAEWANAPVRVYHLSAYYAGNSGLVEWLQSQGESLEEIGTHAGIIDTSILLAVHPEGVRMDKLARGQPNDGTGVTGNPTRANAAYGREELRLQVDAAFRQFQELRRANGR
jgi:creatinine amidohydrolase